MQALTRQKRVLVIDDDELIRNLLPVQLAPLGLHVITAADGAEALSILHSFPACDAPLDLILCDLHLPGLTGAALAAAIRACAPPGIPLLSMSANEPSPEDRHAFDGFLRKPFAPELVLDLFERAAHPLPWQPSSDNVATPVSALPQIVPPLDEAIFASVAAAMPPDQLGHIYSLCLHDSEARIASMRHALLHGDDAAFRASAHAIRGGCGMLGATELQQLAASFELNGIKADTLASLEDFTNACARLRRILVERKL